MSGNSDIIYRNGFKNRDFVKDKINGKLFRIKGLSLKTYNNSEPDIILTDTKGDEWVCHYSELLFRFELIENQDSARILYGNKVGGIK